MENDETTLPEENLETETVDSTTQDSDPLDEITDPEEIRKEAKKFRSIAQRKGKDKPEDKPVVKTTEIPTDVVRKSDLAKIATREAKEMVGKEVAEAWDELMNIPLGGYDPLDPKSIASNVKERYSIYKARNPEKEAKPDVSNLSASTVPQGTGGAQVKETRTFKLPTKPESWYPKKEE